jgi:hypothetical protein
MASDLVSDRPRVDSRNRWGLYLSARAGGSGWFVSGWFGGARCQDDGASGLYVVNDQALQIGGKRKVEGRSARLRFSEEVGVLKGDALNVVWIFAFYSWHIGDCHIVTKKSNSYLTS